MERDFARLEHSVRAGNGDLPVVTALVRQSATPGRWKAALPPSVLYLSAGALAAGFAWRM